jgi:hypothetical protein
MQDPRARGAQPLERVAVGDTIQLFVHDNLLAHFGATTGRNMSSRNIT